MEPEDAERAPRGVRLGVGAAIVLVIVVAVAVVAVAVWRGATAPVEVIPQSGAAAEDAADADGAEADEPGGADSEEAGPGEIYVHVSGAVRSPGLYLLAADARVVDVVSAAGGLADDAAAEGVNLARALADGEQVVVPTAEELAQGEVPGPATDGGGAAAGAGSVVDVNTADEATLETLPGIGPALAGRIVEWREENGAFGSVDDLLAVSGIGEKVLANLRDQVRV